LQREEPFITSNDKAKVRKRKIRLKNGLTATITSLDGADSEFLRKYKKPLLRRFRQLLGKEVIQAHPPIYVVAFYLPQPVYAVCFGLSLPHLRKRLISPNPETAFDFCDATIVNGEIQTQIFAESEFLPLLKASVINKVSPDVAVLLCKPKP
jgi:hypothetical protein